MGRRQKVRDMSIIYKEYDRVLDAYNNGYIDKNTKDYKLTELFGESSYSKTVDIWGFMLGYYRWKRGYEQLTLF